MKLSEHFTLDELTHSDTAVRLGLNNSADQDIIANLQHLAQGLERVRAAMGHVPIYISSAYRSPDVNRAVGGSKTSQHMQGLAADFTAPEFGTPLKICRHLADLASGLQFDQLIYEGRWVHISFHPRRARSEILTAHFAGGGVTYSQGLA